MSMEYTGHKG